jgi:hypothetical protein
MLHPEAGGGSTIFEIGEMSLWKEKANGAHAQVFRYAKRGPGFAAAEGKAGSDGR